MHHIEASIEIDAPPAAVWRVFADFASYPDWNPFIRSLEGEPLVGERLRVRLQPAGRARRHPATHRPRLHPAARTAVARAARPAPHLRWGAPVHPRSRRRRPPHALHPERGVPRSARPVPRIDAAHDRSGVRVDERGAARSNRGPGRPRRLITNRPRSTWTPLLRGSVRRARRTACAWPTRSCRRSLPLVVT